MCIGLKRGIVELVPHQAEWESIAAHTVEVLKNILGNAAVDVQHIGSTSIKLIRAKPIIDIAVAVEDFDAVLAKKTELEAQYIIFCLDERPEQLLFVMGDFAADTRTHHIHVVKFGSREWVNYLNFRDYLNSNESAASQYESVKINLAQKYADDRNAYVEAKCDVVQKLLAQAAEWRCRQGSK